ncbi:hypothetical protein V1264_004930 [Littorina saxatilis]|uniref:Uncharacterized protein n=1 Tax=Littorina saxatilis TaxID=31220 RepID=A0AAN9B2K0_9CAEN
MPRLTSAERERAIGRLEAGDTPEAVAATFQCHISTIYRLLQRFVITGSTADAEQSGRPRVTTPRQDRHIFPSHVAHPFRTAAETARTVIGTHQAPISRQTASRRLRFRGLRNCRPAPSPCAIDRHACIGRKATSIGTMFAGRTCFSAMKAVSALTMPTGVFGYGEEVVTTMLTTVSWRTSLGVGPASCCGAPSATTRCIERTNVLLAWECWSRPAGRPAGLDQHSQASQQHVGPLNAPPMPGRHRC